MIRFREFLVESSTTAAMEMEQIIVAACGGPSFTPKVLDLDKSAEAGKKISNYLRRKGLTGKGKMPKSIYPASDFWHEHFPGGRAKGTTLTPKTDFFIGSAKVSLKTGNAQLMSGGIGEAKATFAVAAEQSGQGLTEAVRSMSEHINNLMPQTNLRKLGVVGNKTELIATGKFDTVEVLKNADLAHHAFKQDLKKLFLDDKKFGQEFVFEAMTGARKFDNNDGTADHFLVTDFEGDVPIIHKVINSRDSYVEGIAGQVKPDVKFKSNRVKIQKKPSDFYTFRSVVGLGVDMLKHEQKKLKEEIELQGDLLTEGWIQNLFKKFYAKVKNWFKNIIAKVKAHIGDSWNKLLQFAELEPVIRFKNNVSW